MIPRNMLNRSTTHPHISPSKNRLHLVSPRSGWPPRTVSSSGSSSLLHAYAARVYAHQLRRPTGSTDSCILSCWIMFVFTVPCPLLLPRPQHQSSTRSSRGDMAPQAISMRLPGHANDEAMPGKVKFLFQTFTGNIWEKWGYNKYLIGLNVLVTPSI